MLKQNLIWYKTSQEYHFNVNCSLKALKSDYILKEDLNLPNQLKVVCQSESFIFTNNMAARIKKRVLSK